MINPKGQSLVELATFGAILLFCLGALIQFGMSANYEQNLQMQTFRKAMRTAYYKSGPAASVSLSKTEDKSMPDPRDPWGFADRRPMSASASATWDSNLQALYIDDYSQTPDARDLPRSIIEINNNSQYSTLGLRSYALSDGGINNIDRSQGAFKTAEYVGPVGCSGPITMVLENPPNSATEYRVETRNCSEIRVKNRSSQQGEPGKEYAYIKIDGLVHTVIAADVDSDNELETIIAVRGSQRCDAQGYCGTIAGLRYVDYQEGEINSEMTQILPWETNKSRDANIRVQQGLIYDYNAIKANNNTLLKTEDPARLQTSTIVNSQQIVVHSIRERDGTTSAYSTTFTPARLDSYNNQGVNK